MSLNENLPELSVSIVLKGMESLLSRRIVACVTASLVDAENTLPLNLPRCAKRLVDVIRVRIMINAAQVFFIVQI